MAKKKDVPMSPQERVEKELPLIFDKFELFKLYDEIYSAVSAPTAKEHQQAVIQFALVTEQMRCKFLETRGK
jgi:hypothetical protein